MSLVPSLLQAIVHVDGEALVMHAGDKPYVVAPAGQIELASSPLALDAVSGIVAQLLPPEFQQALDEFGAVQYELPPQPDFPRERFTVVVARGGDDVWAEIRRRRVLEDGFFDEAMASAERNAGAEQLPVEVVPDSDAEGRPITQIESALSTSARSPARQEPLSPELIEKTAAAEARLDELTRRLTVLDERTKDFQEIEQRVQALVDAARLAEQTPQKTIEGDSRDAEAQDKNLIALAEKVDGLGKRFEAVQHLSSEMRQTQATLETLQKERAEVDELLRGRLRDAEAKDKNLVALAEKVDGLGQRFDALQESRQEVLREAARQAAQTTTNAIERDELQKYREAVRRLSSEMRQTQTTLETLQKERAEVDELRGRLRDADAKDKNLAALAEKVDGLGQRFDALQESRQEVLREAARQAAQTTTNAIERDELQKYREAVQHLSSEMRQTQATLETLQKERAEVDELRGRLRDADAKDKNLVALAEKVDGLGKRFDALEESRQEVLREAVRQAAQTTTNAIEPDELQKYREAVQHLSSEMRQTQATLETLQKERAEVDELRGRLRDADAKDKNLVALAEKVDGLGQRFDALQESRQEVLREAARQAEQTTQKALGPDGELQKHRQAVEQLSSEMRQMQAALVERVDVLGKRFDTVLAQVRDLAKQQSAIEHPAPEDTRFKGALAAPVASPVDDDLALPDLAQLWRDEKANGISVPPAPAVTPTPPARPLPPPVSAPPMPPAATTVPPSSVRPAPPAATIEPPPERPAPQPGVVLPMSRNPIRADREETPAPPADDTLSDLERLLRTAASRGASTLYLASDARPSIRIDGEIQILDGEPVLTSHDVVSLLLTLMPERSHEALRTGATTEWICDIDAIGRVRCMSIRDHRGPGGVFRLMPGRAVSVDQLGLSAEIQALAVEPEGLVLVSGPRSSGKRTLLAALVDLINRTRHDHIITIEREINIVHARGRSIVSQREVRGGNAELLAAARAALREDPDVLVLEQIRTGELMNVALEAAASGHLVIGGLAAHDATETIDRVIDLYAPEHSRQVQFALADNLRGVVAQILLPKTGGGRVAARELLLNTPAVASVLAEGTTSQLPMAIEGGRRHGMVPLTDALVPLVKSGAVETLEACRHVPDRPAFLALLRRHGIDTSLVERRA